MRFQGCSEQNFGFSWRRLRIKKPMKPDSSAGGPQGARKTHPLDDQDGGKTVKKSMPKLTKKIDASSNRCLIGFGWILGGKMEPSWHPNGIKNVHNFERRFFEKSCSRCSGGTIFEIQGVEVGSQDRSKIDQKRNSTWEDILVSILGKF